MRKGRFLKKQRGVSLIEALVAFAVMAFGMVAVVGMQATLRTNGDLARQRAEAVRIAQDYMEEWRGFSTMATTANRLAWDDIQTAQAITVQGTNATYTVTLTANVDPAVADTITPDRKHVTVEVTWFDRQTDSATGTPQSVRLHSALVGLAPEVSGSLILQSDLRPMVDPFNRNPIIPRDARQLPSSPDRGFFWVPPGQTPTAQGRTTVWRFDATTGVITLCDVTAGTSTAQLTAGTGPTTPYCKLRTKTDANGNPVAVEGYALFFGGYIGFAGTGTITPGIYIKQTAPTSITSDISIGDQPACYYDTGVGLQPGLQVRFQCAVPIGSTPDDKWSGTLRVEANPNQPAPPFPLTAADIPPNPAPYYQVCRYIYDSANALPPASYVDITGSLDHQNFLVIPGGTFCPTSPDATVLHQPVP